MSTFTSALESIELRQGGNEASDLLPVTNSALLALHDWDCAFWTCLDEGHVEDNIAIIGHRTTDDRWEIFPLPCVADKLNKAKTDDPEALARHGSFIYVVGSHYGNKAGPLRPQRAWIARFNEDSIEREVPESKIQIEIVRNAFRLHRAINDALDAHDVIPLVPGDNVRTRFIAETIQRGKKADKKWVARLTERDVPLNIEGAAFRPNGNLLLALRFPVTALGQPIIVEVAGIEAMFDGDDETWPTVERIYWLGNVVPAGHFVGFRALTHREGETYDGILGSLDALNKNSVLIEDHPEGAAIHCFHWKFTLPADGSDGEITAELVREFPDLRNVEGLSIVDGRAYYVTDEDDRIQIRRAV